MNKKNTIILICSIFLIFLISTLNLQAGQSDLNNFDFVAKGIKDSLNKEFKSNENYSIIYEEDNDYSDLFIFLNKNINYDKKIKIEKVKINIIYIPYRKFPLFKQRWIRKAYFKGWILKKKDKENKKLVNWIFEDKIKQDPSLMENLNWEWSLGKKINKQEQIKPGFIEPVLAISASLVIILSLFYIRS